MNTGSIVTVDLPADRAGEQHRRLAETDHRNVPAPAAFVSPGSWK
jgi:hypothetical protein